MESSILRYQHPARSFHVYAVAEYSRRLNGDFTAGGPTKPFWRILVT